MARKAKIAVYIGRMQPFTRGHEYVLEHCAKNYDATVVLIGSAYRACDIRNPLTYEMRSSIIDTWYSNSRHPYVVLPLRDQMYNNSKWIQSVQELVKSALVDGFKLRDPSTVEVTIVGSDRDSTTWYLKAFPQWGRDLIEPDPRFIGLAATGIRKRLFEGLSHRTFEELPSVTTNFLDMWVTTKSFGSLVEEYEFLRKYHAGWLHSPHPPQFKTVDATVIQSGHVLQITRARHPGKDLKAVPGGFVKPNQSMLEAMIEELIDETGLLLAEGKRAREITEQKLIGSIVAQREFDHPGRDLRGRMFTTNYLIMLDDTKPLPEVAGQLVPHGEEGGGVLQETTHAEWAEISEARRKSWEWYGDHGDMFETMLGLVGSVR